MAFDIPLSFACMFVIIVFPVAGTIGIEYKRWVRDEYMGIHELGTDDIGVFSSGYQELLNVFFTCD